jgi:NAD+ kinase
MKVLLVPNYSRPDAVDGAAMVDTWLSRLGIETCWAHDTKKLHAPETSIDGVSMVVSFGGDGTLLRAAHIVEYAEVPILGLSFGHLGFLTSGDSDGLAATVDAALAGEMHMSRRATLSVRVYCEDELGAEHCHTFFALNEVALSRGSMGDIVEFDIAVSGNKVDRLRADGFIVATATGSTGYALSAGGPIVTPEFHGMVCVPIAPHTIQARAFLTSPSDVVSLTVSPERPVERCVFLDGQLPELEGVPQRIEVVRGEGDCILLDHDAQSFYRSVSRVFYGGIRDDR